MARFNLSKTKLPIVFDKSGNSGYVVKLKDCSYGSFIRIVKGKKDNLNISNRVYILEEYDRSERKYLCSAFDDISYGRYLKGDTLVFVGFAF